MLWRIERSFPKVIASVTMLQAISPIPARATVGSRRRKPVRAAKPALRSSKVWGWASVGIGSLVTGTAARAIARLRLREDLSQDRTGGGGRGVGAEAAALDRRHDDVLRVVVGRDRRVPGLVLLIGLL